MTGVQTCALPILPQYDAEILTNSKHMADVFEETVKLCGKPKEASNWLMVEAMRLLKEHEMDPDDMGFSPANLANTTKLVKLLSSSSACILSLSPVNNKIDRKTAQNNSISLIFLIKIPFHV